MLYILSGALCRRGVSFGGRRHAAYYPAARKKPPAAGAWLGFALLRRVHVPMLRGGLLTAVPMVCVDVMKEMPITLMTRPFYWGHLAVRILK